jgi:PAS domain S-box-containing protein
MDTKRNAEVRLLRGKSNAHEFSNHLLTQAGSLRIQPATLEQPAYISWLHQAEGTPSESEEYSRFFQGILRSSSDGILATNRENEAFFTNERFVEMWKIPPELMAGNLHGLLLQYVFDQLSDPRDFPKKVRELTNSTEESCDTLSLKDGRVIEILSHSLIDGTDMRGRVWSFRDITARQHAETMHKVLLEIMDGGVTTSDIQDYLGFVHQTLAKAIYAENFFVLLYNKEAAWFEEIYTVDKFDPPSPPSWHEKSISAYVFRTGRPLLLNDEQAFNGLISQGEVELVGTNSPSWMGVPLKTSRETIGVMVVQDYDTPNRYSERDLSVFASIAGQVAQAIERKRNEQSLQEAEAKYRTLVEQIPAVIYLDRYDSGETLYISPYVESMLGYTPEDWKSHPRLCYDIIHPEDLEYVLNATSKSQQTGVVTLEYRYIARDGRVVWVRDEAFLINDPSGAPIYWQGLLLDITPRKKAEEALLESEQRYRTLFNGMMDGVYRSTHDGRFTDVNPAMVRLFGYNNREEMLALDIKKDLYFTPEERENLFLDTGQEKVDEFRMKRKDGSEIWVEDHGRYVHDEHGQVKYHEGLLRDITERKRAELKIQRRVNELEALNQSGIAFSQTMSQKEIGEKVIEVLVGRLDWHHAAVRMIREGSEQIELLAFSHGGDDSEKDTRIQSSITRKGQGMVGWVIEHGHLLKSDNLSSDSRYIETYPGMKSGLYAPMKIFGKIIGCISVESEVANAFTEDDERLLITLAVQAAVALENARLFEAERHRRQDAETLRRAAAALTSSLDLDQVLAILLDGLAQVVPYTSTSVFILDDESVRVVAARGFSHPEKLIGQSFPANDKLSRFILESRKSLILDDALSDPHFGNWTQESHIRGWMGIPLLVRDRIIGYLTVDNDQPNIYNQADAEMGLAFASQAAVAIENARLFDQLSRRLKQLSGLHSIDLAIGTLTDLRVILNVMLNNVTKLLNADAAAVLLYNPHLHLLEYKSGVGFYSNEITHTCLRLGQDFAGQTALDKGNIYIQKGLSDNPQFVRSKLVEIERFQAYACVPLVAKGEVKGVLEIYNRSPLEINFDWKEFLNMLASQAAIATDNASLFENLQASNIELSMAYDATIEGWSRALDLRDRETEGHTQRVTQMTLELASRMGMPETELVHIRRGSLLHDMGKLGVPDNILLKPGELTDEEWILMRRHPQYAYDMLEPIKFLHPALDIPYCHHEKWNGTGYPRGLKGEQIPLAARIFAIMDVWDALTSDRPYRQAWPREQSLQYIKEQAGIHFDPGIVGPFLRLINDVVI